MHKLWLPVAYLLASCSTAVTPPAQSLASEWGGDHIGIAFVADQAVIELDCAAGAIRGPFALNRDGSFRWHGTYTRGIGGPVRIGEMPPAEPAIYEGWVKEATMSLAIRLDPSQQALGSFVLERGRSARILRCL